MLSYWIIPFAGMQLSGWGVRFPQSLSSHPIVSLPVCESVFFTALTCTVDTNHLISCANQTSPPPCSLKDHQYLSNHPLLLEVTSLTSWAEDFCLLVTLLVPDWFHHSIHHWSPHRGWRKKPVSLCSSVKSAWLTQSLVNLDLFFPEDKRIIKILLIIRQLASASDFQHLGPICPGKSWHGMPM